MFDGHQNIGVLMLGCFWVVAALDERSDRFLTADRQRALDEEGCVSLGHARQFVDELGAAEKLRNHHRTARCEVSGDDVERKPAGLMTGAFGVAGPIVQRPAKRVDVHDLEPLRHVGPKSSQCRLARCRWPVEQHQHGRTGSRLDHTAMLPRRPKGQPGAARYGDRMHRVAVVGSSGVGKSTVAGEIARRLDVSVIELDDLMHGPNWTPTPTPEFRARVAAALADAERASNDGGWVVPGNYRQVADMVQRRADTIVWLDLPRRVVMKRLISRSLRRVATKADVCNGNRESLRNLFSRDPERNVVLWSWQHHDQYREIYEGYADGEFWSGAAVHRLRRQSDVDALLAGIDR